MDEAHNASKIMKLEKHIEIGNVIGPHQSSISESVTQQPISILKTSTTPTVDLSKVPIPRGRPTTLAELKDLQLSMQMLGAYQAPTKTLKSSIAHKLAFDQWICCARCSKIRRPEYFLICRKHLICYKCLKVNPPVCPHCIES